MPFTVSHVAAVVPAFRGPLVPMALAGGATAPDLPYFLRATGIPVGAQSWYEPLLNGSTSHGFPGALTVSVPVALVVYLGYLVARRPMGSLAPHGPPAAPAASPATVAWVLLSAALGVLTHVVWDSFTHGDGWVVENVAFLQQDVAGGLTWARALQHLSTVLGLVVLAVWAWRRRDRWLSAPATPARRRQLLALGVAATVAVVGALLTTRSWWGGTDGLTSGQVLEGVLSDAAKGAGAAVVVAAALAVVVWWVRQLGSRART